MTSHTMLLPFAMAVLLLIIAPPLLQAGESPYAGQQTRAIKALSPQEIRDLRNGAGIGFAKPAELNHYPGPAHVIELAHDLDLSSEQNARTRSLYEQMKGEAVSLGEKIIARERHLDTLFSSGTIDEDSLHAVTNEIALLRGKLRAVHLKYHLKMKTLLTPHQIGLYDHLRGYSTSKQKSGADESIAHPGGHNH